MDMITVQMQVITETYLEYHQNLFLKWKIFHYYYYDHCSSAQSIIKSILASSERKGSALIITVQMRIDRARTITLNFESPGLAC